MSDQDVLFRAWHTQEKKMLFFSLWGLLAEYGDEGNYCSIVDTDLFQYGRDIPNLKIMQFTGLKDKNDKKVYAGDIVRYEHSNPTGWQEYTRAVTWNEKAAAFEVPTAGIFTRNIEVIGNIYENPELVE